MIRLGSTCYANRFAAKPAAVLKVLKCWPELFSPSCNSILLRFLSEWRATARFCNSAAGRPTAGQRTPALASPVAPDCRPLYSYYRREAAEVAEVGQDSARNARCSAIKRPNRLGGPVGHEATKRRPSSPEMFCGGRNSAGCRRAVYWPPAAAVRRSGPRRDKTTPATGFNRMA